MPRIMSQGFTQNRRRRSSLRRSSRQNSMAGSACSGKSSTVSSPGRVPSSLQQIQRDIYAEQRPSFMRNYYVAQAEPQDTWGQFVDI
mmetsp:Transcript_18517/g.27985  ORF Transcript_18517/g.27985 Transcript_18517/m.27985 type:complete len:87 (+) Transcript_18517:122-382(+)